MTKGKVLVTGGGGYKGVVLSERLALLGYDVTILDVFAYGQESILHLLRHPNVRAVRQDVRTLKRNDLAEYDAVCHLAAISGLPACEQNAHSAWSINVEGLENVVSNLALGQRLVFPSSTSVYGNAGSRPCTEDMELPEAVSLYARTKMYGEAICREHPGTVVFRFATMFGVSPRMRWDLMANYFTMRAIHEGGIIVYGGHKRHAFIHLDDAVDLYVQAIEGELAPGVWNAGSESCSKLQLAEEIGKHVPFQAHGSSDPGRDLRDFSLDTTKLRSTGWEPRRSMAYGIGEMVRLFQFYQPTSPYAHL